MPENDLPPGLCYLPPAIPANETQRLNEVLGLKLLDTPPEERFDRIVRLARVVFNVPITYVSLIAEDRQFFKARTGLDMQGTTRQVSMCGHAILQDKPMIVPDVRKDHRFANNPLVIGEPFVRFYAGNPLRGPNGYKVGTLCVIDRSPRSFEQKDIDLLKELAALVERELELTNVINAQAEVIQVKEALEKSERELAKTVEQLQIAKDQTDGLQNKGQVTPVRYEEVAILFADFAGFTKVSSAMDPEILVQELNECFCH